MFNPALPYNEGRISATKFKLFKELLQTLVIESALEMFAKLLAIMRNSFIRHLDNNKHLVQFIAVIKNHERVQKQINAFRTYEKKTRSSRWQARSQV